VASALNYLTRRYTIDYFFYAYGSFLLTTRRVNEDAHEINLSTMVKKIGSPADGGHPSAATGSPETNPAFPEKRFESINDRNFAEYLYYITDIVEENTDLERIAIEEQYPDECEPGARAVLERLEKNVFNLKLRGTEGVANVCVAKGVYTEDDEPSITVPMAFAYLHDVYPMDYFFYVGSPSQLVMRNINDNSETLDLDEVARILGTFRDGGHPRAATCQPRFNPEFNENKFKYVNDKNISEFVKYLGKRIWEELDFDDVDCSRY
ncbi:MAG: hypothetical protein ABEJ65_06810, partial [bacterium]